ncbi:hypothetical protein T069G_07352 [Trichoderma breve]|uniref:Uncharacterized protein n=1 Tax=Trichoderma breve TaxID=2034170 RepID=A0A9W9E6C5_9HYPO|nr:hypothetical protein T069G_07352 [Trichoderma breve]KAJ4859085.1 hypothetical protein T069G_07352 [Trichoderma breve]
MAPEAASATTPDSGTGSSSKPAGTWDNIALLNDLLVAFYQVGNQAGNFNTQTNEAVVAFMTAQGHVTSWSAIRTKNGFFSPVDEVDPPGSRGYPRIRVLQLDPIY